MAKPQKNDLRGVVMDIIMRFFGQQNVLTVSVPLIDATGSIKAALFLSQLIYWTDRSTIAGGWVAKTYDEWREEIRLSKFEIRAAVTALREAGIETNLAKWNGAPTVHYRINREMFHEWIIRKLSAQQASDCAESEHSIVKKVNNPLFTKRTIRSAETEQSKVQKLHNPLTETTAETTHRLPTPARAMPAERDVIFDAIALHIFGIQSSVPKSLGGRVAKVKKALIEIENGEVPSAAAAARISEFVRWYKSYHPDLSIPRDAGKVSEYYLAYRAWAAERDRKAAPVVAPVVVPDIEMPAAFDGIDLSLPTTLDEQRERMQAVIARISANFSGEN